MVSRDAIKILSLVAVTLLCAGSLFTSLSISIMDSVDRVVPITHGGFFCAEPEQVATDCEARSLQKESSTKTEDCSIYREAAKKCNRVVQSAFSYVNFGGCLKELKLENLCAAEWCNGRGSDQASCERECAGTRNNVSVCVQQIVEQYFRRNGLKENGTIG